MGEALGVERRDGPGSAAPGPQRLLERGGAGADARYDTDPGDCHPAHGSATQCGTQHRENAFDVHQPFDLVLIDFDVELDLEMGE